MILRDAPIQRRNLAAAVVVGVAVVVGIVALDRTFSQPSTWGALGLALGYLGFALADGRRVTHQIVGATRGGSALYAAWFAAIGPILIGAAAGVLLGLLIRTAMNYFSLIRVVGVRSPIALMELGGSDTVLAGLFFKPRYTTAPVAPVAGTITFYKDATGSGIYTLSNGGASHAVAANLNAAETLTGVRVGVEVMGVSGFDATGTTFDAMGVEVHVVEPMRDSIALYRLAIQLATKWWETGPLGNLRININSSPPAGLCDEWTDWAADWLVSIAKGDVCKIEKMLSPSGSHAYLRVTMCDGTVYYLDPWRRPDDPVFTKDEYESAYKGTPADVKVHWER